MMSKATAVIRGAKRSHVDLCNRAKGKQRNARLSGDEAAIMEAFREAGLAPVPLLALDKYNVDFGFTEQRLAVEYHGGNWHNSSKKIAQDARKADFLASQGWRLIVFPRIVKPRTNDSGNIRVEIAEIVRRVVEALHVNPPLTQ